MKIEAFAVEQWMDAHENTCTHNCAETCVDSVTVEELLQLAGWKPDELSLQLLPLKLAYGEIRGTQRLRAAIARLYPGRGPDDVLITHGAIGANHLLYSALISPGDEVVAVVPNYQQHTSIPEALGAQVHRLWLRREDAYRLDLAALEKLVTPRTRIICYSNPNNPTGAVMDADTHHAVLRIAASVGAYVLADEVYRGIDLVWSNKQNAQHTQGSGQAEGLDMGESAAQLDAARGISVGSMSKAFAMAGVRLGWIVGPPEVLEQVMIHRDYNTISVGRVDDTLASLALSPACLPNLLARNRAIVQHNAELLDAFVSRFTPHVSWVRPEGGTVALLHYSLPGRPPSTDLCLGLLKEEGVLFVPGSAFGVEGALRIGFGNPSHALMPGLEALGRYLEKLLAG